MLGHSCHIATAQSEIAINVSLAFCMGTDLDSIMDSPLGQPMAQIFFNSFGKTGTLVVWVSIYHADLIFVSSYPSTFSRLGRCGYNSVCGDSLIPSALPLC